MPTPVSAARQCLAGEAAAALDEAVAVARRRSHAQTTSLHVVSALLSLPSSSSSLLRDALSRARSSAYPSRLQFKALELCFSVALDRLPSSSAASSPADPPVSNSLMAAVKRSQANQRRNPETFHLYQQQQQQSQQSPSFACVKVDLQQMILSILDDPVVSRVFGEAGFRSCDIKFAVLRPPPILRFPRATRCPPLFLCNFSGDDFDVTPSRSFGFPFSAGQLLCSDGADENCRRIGQVLAREKGRNPLLVGAGASDAASDFESTVGRQNWAVLPPETRGLKLVSIEREVSEFLLSGGNDPLLLDSRFGELGRLVEEESQSGPGVIVNFGDLKVFVDTGAEEEEESNDRSGVNYLVAELTRLLGVHRERLWLMGSAASYETYTKFSARFPSVNKDWDLQLLPITSLRPGSGGLYPRPNSLMESFVPFGGFFPMAYDTMSPLSRPHQSVFRCQHCNDKYEQEVSIILKESSVPVPDQHQTNLPPWLRKTELVSINNKLDLTKAKDDGAILLNAKIADLQRKWNEVCQRHHRGSQILGTDNCRIGAEAFPPSTGDLRRVADKERTGNEACKIKDAASVQSGHGNVFPITASLQKTSSLNQSMSKPVVSESENLLSRLQGGLSKSERLQKDGLLSQSGASSKLDIPGGQSSSSFVPSVTTDLMLGTVHAHLPKGERPTIQSHIERLNNLSGCFPSKKVDMANKSVLVAPAQSSFRLSYSDPPVLDTHLHVHTPSDSKITSGGVSVDKRYRNSSSLSEQIDLRDFKALYGHLMENVGRQEEAICAVSETVSRCRAGNERLRGASLKGDIWLTFLGPDKIGKRRIAAALAELVFGSREKLICVDLSLQGGISNRICDRQEINGSDVNFRGKMVVDHIADEISKKPCSVIFLENVDKSDFLLQSSLSQAIKTGKFSDSHGREVGINNAILVTTARSVKGKTAYPMSKECVNFSEERILTAEGHEMRIWVEPVSNASCLDQNGNVVVTARKEPGNKNGAVYVSKRKLNFAADTKEQCESSETPKRAHKASNTFLDLNLPVEEMASADTDSSSEDSNCLSENSEAWLEDFLDSMDETVFFRPFDFDALADKILKEVTKTFQSTIGSECLMEIHPRVMEQILAATWLLEDMEALNNWLWQVLDRSFIEARKRYYLSTQTVMRLVACEDAFMKDQAPGILLPSRIHLN